MAVVGQVASGYEDHACAFSEGFQNKVTVYPTRTHHSYSSERGWMFKTAGSSEIGSCVATPVAEKAKYLLLGIHFQGCANLIQYLFICEVHLCDGIGWAFSNACTAAVTHGWCNLCWLVFRCTCSSIWANLLTDGAFHSCVLANFLINNSNDRLDLPFGFGKNGRCPTRGSASLRHAVRDILWGLTGSCKQDSVYWRVNWLEFWVAFHEEAVCSA